MSNEENALQASFSALVLSIGSTAAMSMGLAPNPTTGKVEKNLPMAKFNIDMLVMLKDKTKGNLSAEDQNFLDMVISDLQMKFVQSK